VEPGRAARGRRRQGRQHLDHRDAQVQDAQEHQVPVRGQRDGVGAEQWRQALLSDHGHRERRDLPLCRLAEAGAGNRHPLAAGAHRQLLLHRVRCEGRALCARRRGRNGDDLECGGACVCAHVHAARVAGADAQLLLRQPLPRVRLRRPVRRHRRHHERQPGARMQLLRRHELGRLPPLEAAASVRGRRQGPHGA